MGVVNQRHRRGERGSVAVEMAYAFPFLILVFMVMMFLLDVIMVKQEVTVSGFSAMTQCASVPNKRACLLAMIDEGQTFQGSNARYSCNANDQTTVTRQGSTFVVINLRCSYEGFTPINAIFRMIGQDMTNVLDFDIPVFFPDAC